MEGRFGGQTPSPFGLDGAVQAGIETRPVVSQGLAYEYHVNETTACVVVPVQDCCTSIWAELGCPLSASPRSLLYTPTSLLLCRHPRQGVVTTKFSTDRQHFAQLCKDESTSLLYRTHSHRP